MRSHLLASAALLFGLAVPCLSQAQASSTRIDAPQLGLEPGLDIVGAGFFDDRELATFALDEASSDAWTAETVGGGVVGSMLIPPDKYLLVHDLTIRANPAMVLAIPFPAPSAVVQDPDGRGLFRVDPGALVCALDGITMLTGWLVDANPVESELTEVRGVPSATEVINLTLRTGSGAPAWTPGALNGGVFDSLVVPANKRLIVKRWIGGRPQVSDGVSPALDFTGIQLFQVLEGHTLSRSSISSNDADLWGYLVDAGTSPAPLLAGPTPPQFSRIRIRGIPTPAEIVNFNLVVGGSGAWSATATNGSLFGSMTVPAGKALIIEWVRNIDTGWTVEITDGPSTVVAPPIIAGGKFRVAAGHTITLSGGPNDEAAFFGYLVDE